MKIQWCWRCQMEVPMLDEGEFSRAWAAYRSSREAHGGKDDARSSSEAIEPRFAPFLEMYRQITGYAEKNPNAAFHHRLSLYGPPCSNCGKPLRSSRAKLCAECGVRADWIEANQSS